MGYIDRIMYKTANSHRISNDLFLEELI